ncbi:MAG: response regulator transcription factor [Gammaproteobacteria bacterium]
MRILLVDDHDLFREGLKFLLPVLDDSIEFVEADSFESAQQASGDLDIDLILLDYYMPGVVGLDALKQFREEYESAMVVVVSGEEDPKVIRAAIENGASGYIPKTSSKEELEKALRIILAGGTYLPNQNIDKHESPVDSQVMPGVNELYTKLSPRQYEVLMKVIQGKANKVIARELLISDQTVKTHLSQAFKILDVKNRTEAVYIAAKLGMRPQNQAMEQQ